MGTVLIVGASRGIGRELARQYAGEGWRVHATARTPGGVDIPGIPEEAITWHQLDVRDDEGIRELVRALGDAPIDILIHNAGVHDRDHPPEVVMEINADAPFRVVEPLLGNVARSRERKVLLMSSQLGARRGRRGSLGVYGDSKAALNDRFREREPAWRALGVTAIVLHPGWVRTDMGGAGAPVGVEESAAGIRRVLRGLEPSQSGSFLTWEGEVHPW